MSTRGRVLSIKLRVNFFLTHDLEREKQMSKGKKGKFKGGDDYTLGT
jgi:hypothetical protein